MEETRIIGNPEFLNITPYNPLISQCEIKVCYEGENRNGTVFSKETLTKMANTLPGNPIVGYYKEEVEDFRDHGDQMIIDEGGLRFKCLTKPYGFIGPEAKVWFQKFEEFDEKSKQMVVREYLMTTGYLWTGQFPECQSVVEEGRPQSMEIDKDTLDGQWAKNYKNGLDFFIINDGIFSKLCILGEDVEPCFEGASITAPSVSTSFNLNEFKQALISMAQDLKFALKGDKEMPEMEKIQTSSEVVEEQIPTETSFAKKEEEEKKEESSAQKESSEEKTEEPKKEEDEDKKKDKFAKKDDEEKEPPVKEKEDKEEKPSEDKKEEEEKEKKKYALLEKDYSELKEKYSSLESEIQSLREFKNEIESKEKDALINSFYMLSDEDKKEVIENKAQYSLDDIEAKLSVICVRKRVNFSLDEQDSKEEEQNPITTFNLESQVDASTPAWVQAVINTQKSREI